MEKEDAKADVKCWFSTLKIKKQNFFLNFIKLKLLNFIMLVGVRRCSTAAISCNWRPEHQA
jgi:hypothetical protein